PIFKTQEEARGLDVDLKKLNLCVLYCKDSKDKLTKSKCKVLDYINTAESKPYEINKRPSFNNQLFGRTNWYDITKYLIIGDFIFPAKIGERYRLIDNRETLVTCDKVNYAIKVKPEYKAYSNDIFLILNSICFRFFIDLFSRQMVVKVSDVDVNLVQKTYVLDPQVFHENAKNIKNIYESLKSREQESIFKEIDKEDKKAIDLIILKSIGLGDKELEELYKQAALYVQLRKEKSDSLKTKKTKKIMDYNTSLRYIDERFSDIPRYRNVLGGFNCEKLSIPSGKPIFQKESSYQPDLFSEYFVAFKDAKKTNNMLFKNQHQIELFRFLSLIGYDKKSIKLPINPDDCYKVLQIFNDAYSNNIQLIKSLLKSNRSKADAKSIFRDLIFS
ncbi:MAG: hypothetical protein FJ041_01400, partial [Candidatus Cloacimonetes bacterium]|nr:hypothetical protein [Candidatus Cloacimonadota bacterium]